MRVAIQGEEASGRQGAAGQSVVQVLPCGIPIELDRHASLRRRMEHGIPVGDDTGPRSQDPAAGMSQNANARVRNRSEHPVSLIVILT